MDEDRAWRVIDAERSRLADILERLSEPEWATPSLCQAWTVRDVAAHLTLSHTGPLSAGISLVRAGGSFNRMVRDTAIRQARLPVAEFPRRIRAMVGSRRTAPFLSAYEPLIDILCHSQDIARPTGRRWPMPAEAAMAAAAHIWKRAFPFQAQRRLRGCKLVATDVPWVVGTGEQIEGPISALLLVLSGRPAGMTELSGPGVTRLMGSFPPEAGPSRASPTTSVPQEGS